MNPGVKAFNVFFNSKSRFVVPVYQRAYSWGQDNWFNLWRDISYKYIESLPYPLDKIDVKSHFMGTLITQQDGSIGAGDISVYRVVDGQQRLTTIFTLLAVIRDFEHYLLGKPVNKLNSLSHILDLDVPDDPNPPTRFSIQESDQVVLDSIATGNAPNQNAIDYKSSLFKVYEFFLYQLWNGEDSIQNAQISTEPKEQFQPPKKPKTGFVEKSIFDYWSNQGRAMAKSKINTTRLRTIVLQKLSVLELLLEDKDEDAATIFESVNSKTQPLQQFDHIKNSIFVRLVNNRDEFFNTEWKPVVTLLHKVSYSGKRSETGDQFIYDYLIARGEFRKGPVNKRRAYIQFMSRLDDKVPGPTSKTSYEAELIQFLKEDFLRAARHWPAAVGHSSDVQTDGKYFKLKDESIKVIKSIMELTAGPPVPVVFHLLEGFTKGKIAEKNLNEALGQIESFVARHSLIGTPLSPFRSLFMQIMVNFSGSYDLGVLQKELIDKKWPSDNQLIEKVPDIDLYGRLQSRQINAIFRGLEEQLSGPGHHPLVFGKAESAFSVEHIFPESEVNEDWKKEFAEWGMKESGIHELKARQHRLGNLTPVCNKNNKQLGKKAFSKKCELLKKSIAPLSLYQSITNCRRWTVKEVNARSNLLVKVAIKKWPRPIA